MNEPVDLTNLRDMIDGDREMEKALFAEFFSSFDEGLITLRETCGEGREDSWKKSAHAMKGISLNLGAQHLGELCKIGQDEPYASIEDKKQLLKDIEAEYARVREYLLNASA